MTEETLRQRLDALNSEIQQGRIMEAMKEFYADDVVMSENDAEATIGLEANLSREQDFVDKTEWHGLELKDVVVDGDTAMVRWWMDFTNTSYGQRLAFTQVAFQRWRDGKISEERFYYSPTPLED
jgi:ketosteroid isomerase-like protein